MSKRTLLLADDSVTIQKVVNLTFADEGINVITVGDGDAAMQKISESIPDIVLADVHMPGLSGYRICEIIRENPATKDLPVVLLVGSFEPYDEDEAARVGASAYLTKPFQSIRQLVSQVSTLMASPSQDQAPQNPYQEPLAAEPVRDTSDIESLYHQSFTGSQSVEAEPTSAAVGAGTTPYVDMGMDDEMIDTTTYAGEPASISTEAQPEYSAVSSGGEGAARAFESYATEVHQEDASSSQAAEDDLLFDDSSAESNRSVTAEFTLDDEMELLELPPITGGQTVEITTPGVGTQVVNLTPELMETIVDKVVEKLSKKN